MTDSPVNYILIAAAGAFCLITGTEIASAQQSGKQPAAPQTVLPATASPQTATPQSKIKMPEAPVPVTVTSKPRMLSAPKKIASPTRLPRPVPRAVTGGGVQVDSLSAVNADEVGVLVPSTGALGIDMWAGTPAALVTRLVPELPVNIPSPTLRDLMRRLLLSPARSPEGSDEGPGLIPKRIELLMMIGDLKGASDLLRALPDVQRKPELVRLEADLSFLAYDSKRACALAEREMPLRPTSYWQKAFNFCEIINGRSDKASLGISLMRELGEADEAYFLLAESLIAKEPLILDSLPNPTPLHFAMVREANTAFPADILGSNIPIVSRAVATSSLASQGLRLEAAERADAAGALPKATLRQLYASVEFSEADRANPLSRAEVEFGPMVRALLYHTALTQTVPTAKAEASSRAFALARDEGRYASTVQVFEPVLHRIPPSADLKWFAPEAVRAFLVIGDNARAEAWYQIIQSSAGLDEGSRKALGQFKPIAWLFKFANENTPSAEIISAWSEAHKDDPEVADKAALIFNVLEALGFEVPEEAWIDHVRAAPRLGMSLPNPGLWRRILALANGESDGGDKVAGNGSWMPDPAYSLSASSGGKTGLNPVEISKVGSKISSQVLSTPLDAPGTHGVRVGETVLLALIAIGNAGPAKVDPFVLREVLKAMNQAGLKKEARALALDAVLARGL